MNTTEILNKSLAWLHTKERKMTGTSREIVNLLLDTHTFSPSQMGGSELSEQEGHLYASGNGFIYNSHTTESDGNTQVAPQELYILTQVILNTLNTEPERFHDMAALPGLESRNRRQLGQIARYLLNQVWIELRATRTGVLIKLTIEGKIYLGNHNAWA
jgi:hypothetical protein